MDETLKDIFAWIVQVILCVESLCRDVVPYHSLTALSRLLLIY